MKLTLRSPIKITRDDDSITIEIVPSRTPKKERTESFMTRYKRHVLADAEATVAKLRKELQQP